jgi:hypothetical protein
MENAVSMNEGFSPYFEDGEIPIMFFRSERRCPKCRRCLNIDGKGDFRCPGCDYTDKQDVSKLYAAGLNYNVHSRKPMRAYLANYNIK